MTDITIAFISMAALLLMILAGTHIGVALGLASFVAMIFITGNVDIAMALLSQTASAAVNEYIVAVVPLFILMGAFMTNSRAAGDLYTAMHLVVGRIRGGLAVATVYANAVFAAVTGVSVASAAVFSTISYPQMVNKGYSKRLALGSVAGSSVLGMLIPPSLLLILYGILAQVSIGSLFIAGVIPGLLLATIYSIGIIVIGTARPEMVGLAPRGGRTGDEEAAGRSGWDAESGEAPYLADDAPAANEIGTVAPAKESLGKVLARSGPILLLIVLVIGGIWGGFFTPTEASAVGAFGALLVGLLSGMTWKSFLSSFRETAAATGSIMLLLIAAQMYSRMLATSGLVARLGQVFASWDLPELAVVGMFVLFLILLGAILDSSSIILLTVPLMLPVLALLGTDPLWFGIVMIVSVEVGMLTPPFGMVAFAMSGVLGDEVDVSDIFIGAFPFFIMMLLFIALLVFFPALSTWLPGLL